MLQVAPLSNLPLVATSAPRPLANHHEQAALTATSEKVNELAVTVFRALITPGYFSSAEFYQTIEVVLGSLSGLGVIGCVVYFFMGKTDCLAITIGFSVTSAAGSALAGRTASLQPLKESTDKLKEQVTQQTAHIENYQTLFRQFSLDLGQFEKFSEENQEELTKRIKEFQTQIDASGKLWRNLFEERKSFSQDQRKFLDDLKNVVKEIKDPDSALRKQRELDAIVAKLHQTQNDLAFTEGQIKESVRLLQDLEEKHTKIVVRYEKEARNLELSNQTLAGQLERSSRFNLA